MDQGDRHGAAAPPLQVGLGPVVGIHHPDVVSPPPPQIPALLTAKTPIGEPRLQDAGDQGFGLTVGLRVATRAARPSRPVELGEQNLSSQTCGLLSDLQGFDIHDPSSYCNINTIQPRRARVNVARRQGIRNEGSGTSDTRNPATVVFLAEGLQLLEGFPNLQAYTARLKSRPAWQRATSD